MSSSSGNADSPDVESVETQEDLPSCTSKLEGKVRFVEEDEAYFVCLDGIWEEVGEYVATEEDLPSCSAKRDGQVYYVGDLEESLVCKDKKWVDYDPSGDESDDEECDEDEEDCDEESSSSSNVIASSSSAKQSSSSEEESSSSVVFPDGVKPSGYYKDNCPSGHTCTDAAPSTYLKSGITYGEILDTRDYQVYKVVTIGEGDGAQTWMAQNLNYDPGNVSSMGEYAWSGCYGEGGFDYASESNLTDAQVAENCSKYGRLYTWEVAMDKAGCGYGESCNNSYEGSQGICPEGWHLPTHAEWDSLFTNVGGENVAGRMLKSEEGWIYYSESTKGIDYYGLSALPAGDRSYGGNFYYAGRNAIFWSSSEDSSYDTYYMYLNYDDETAYQYDGSKDLAFSVRCLQNN